MRIDRRWEPTGRNEQSQYTKSERWRQRAKSMDRRSETKGQRISFIRSCASTTARPVVRFDYLSRVLLSWAIFIPFETISVIKDFFAPVSLVSLFVQVRSRVVHTFQRMAAIANECIHLSTIEATARFSRTAWKGGKMRTMLFEQG